MTDKEAHKMFQSYFSLFPLNSLSKFSEGLTWVVVVEDGRNL